MKELVGPGKEFLDEMLKQFNEGGLATVGEVVTYCVVKLVYKEKGEGKKDQDKSASAASKEPPAAMDTSSDEKDRALVSLVFNPMSAVKVGGLEGIAGVARLRETMLAILEAQGAERAFGGPPAGRAERKVQNDYQNLKKRKEKKK